MTDHSASRRLDVLQEQAPHLIAQPSDRAEPVERVLAAIGRLQDETAGTPIEPLVAELVAAMAEDTTVVELRQELAFRDAELDRLRER